MIHGDEADAGYANVAYNTSVDDRLSPSVVRSVPSARVLRSGSVIRMTDNSPGSPYWDWDSWEGDVDDEGREVDDDGLPAADDGETDGDVTGDGTLDVLVALCCSLPHKV